MGKKLQNILFLFKKIQIGFKTWKNGIEIAFAYANAEKIITTIFSKKTVKWFFLVVAMFFGVGAIFHFREHIKGGISEIKNFSSLIAHSFQKKEQPQQKSVDSTYKKGEPPSDTLALMESVESTLLKPSIEGTFITKPIIQKFAYKEIKDSSMYLALIANKAFKTMYLLQKQDEIWRVVREYDIAIGEQEGRKTSAGDKKTPEGQYFVVGRKESSELSSIYGPLAYVLNYPNEEDRKAGRTGQGIWIHGTSPDSVPVETKGCLEMKNEELKEISGLLKDGIGIPVLIVNNLHLINPVEAYDFKLCDAERWKILDNYHKTKLQFEQFLTKWKIAWETKNINEYKNFYDTLQFIGQGLDWDGWRERKLRTFSLYDTIAISIENILITDYSESSTIIKFFQIYKTNLNRNENAKKLTLMKDSEDWKITSESTCLKEELLL